MRQLGLTRPAKPDDALLREADKALERMEAVMRREVKSKVETVDLVGLSTLQAGGKRLRPALTYFCGKASDPGVSEARLAEVGACLELIHTATLVHDDVIDQAETRRGKRTAASEFGNTAAVLSGDVLLARAMRILAMDGDLAVIRAVSGMVVEMAEGEVREVECRGRFDLSEDDYMAVLRMKTAAFVENCCQVGGLVASAQPAVIEALKVYGNSLGMAFQIADDLLDYQAEESESGKPRGIDFREGQATLPLILLRESASGADLEYLRARFGTPVSDAEFQQIRNWMVAHCAFARAEALALDFVGHALGALEALEPSPYREGLASLAEFSVARRS
ncbi:MAG: polyprenyl synthetase family protein [Fimbriimonadaceae bacterium]|nr:MAG: polyprenyl synthetase family protein [Fimbriimonadaceae bacterium]